MKVTTPLLKGKNTWHSHKKNRKEEEVSAQSTDEEPKPQRPYRNGKQRKSNENIMNKMAMVICHGHFHIITNGVSYTRILKKLCERNNLPYVTPLDTDPDSRKSCRISQNNVKILT